MKDLKILHIVAGNLNGGAAKGALWLHQGLQDLHVDSRILINTPNTQNDPSIYTIVPTLKSRLKFLVKAELDQLPLKLYKNRIETNFDTGMYGFDITSHFLYDWADIVHLHWVNGGFIKTKDISKIKKPIVWTLRDMWPFTGVCHYSLNCENYKFGCGTCSHLASDKKSDLSSYIVKQKLKYYPKSIKVVGISEWLTEKAKESKVFLGFDIQTIPNNIDTEEFFPVEKQTARNILGLKTTKKIVLAGAQNIQDNYKGFDKYIEAIKSLNTDDVFLLFFGKLNEDIIQELKFDFKSFGFLNDTVSMRLVYSAADVFVAPSIQDAFGKTVAESMSCGTPVVCFDATGPKDIVDHKINGYKAKPFDSDELKNGINWVLNSKNYKELSVQANLKVAAKFAKKQVAKQYIDLYSQFGTKI
jgi:glycosyltransferase involved in cell wall biosynthesis